MKKVCKKRIFVVFSIIMVSFVMLSFFTGNVSAEINPNTNTEMADFAKGLNGVAQKLNEFTFNSVIAGISAAIGGIAILIYMSIATIFSGATGSIFPTPDNIIFNRIAILDINFFNPNGNSVIGFAGGIIQKLYNSFHTIAISVFIIAAMIVGIKMAFSTVAFEKSQAKKALVNWLTGIVVLFLMRLIIAAIFEANEYIVWKISNSLETQVMFDIKFPLRVVFMGNPILSVINGVFELLTNTTNEVVVAENMPGYGGMLTMFAVNAFCGDLFSAILFFVLLGQTLTLFVAYAKRLMYSIILGLVAPLVVAVDTINKSIKGQSTILSNWFKEFIGIVFIQVFHSLLMLVTLSVISALSNVNNNSFVGIATIVLTSGIVKFEKLYKQIFGISDGMLGGLKGQAGKIMQTAAGVSTAVKAVGDNGKKVKQSIKSKDEAKEKLKIAQEKSSETRVKNALDKIQIAAQVEKDPEKRKKILEGASNLIQEAENLGYNPDTLKNFKTLINNFKNGTYAPSMTGSTVRMAPTTSQSVNTNYQNSSNTSNTNTSNTNNSSSNQFSEGMSAGNSNGSSAIIQSNKDIQAEIAKLRKEITSNSKGNSIEAMDKQIKAAEKEISQANKTLGSAVFATAMSPINLAAGIGFGLGSGEDMAGSALKGGMVTAGLDLAAEKIGGQIGKVVSNSVSKEVRNGMKSFDKHSNVGDI